MYLPFFIWAKLNPEQDYPGYISPGTKLENSFMSIQIPLGTGALYGGKLIFLNPYSQKANDYG